MTVEITALARPSGLDDAGDISAALSTTFVLVDQAGWTTFRRVSVESLFESAQSDSWEFGLQVASGLSGTKQVVTVAGVSSALRISTTAVEVDGTLNVDLSINVGAQVNCESFQDLNSRWKVGPDGIKAFGGALVGQQTITGATDTDKVTSIIALLKAFGFAAP